MSNSCRGRTQEDRRRESPSSCRSQSSGDAPTVRALKRVRFAADRVEDDAETPEATSASAPSSLPAEDATTNSLPAHSSEAAVPASAVEVPDQVMSEGACSVPDAAVRLSMKRSSVSSHSESETKRLHTDHFTRDVLMLLDDPDVSRAVEQCREICRRKEAFLVDVNDCDFVTNCVLAAQMVRLLLAPVVEPPENSCRMNRVFSIFLLLPVMAMVICRGTPWGSVFVNTNVASWERLDIAQNSIQFWSIVPRGGGRLHRQDGRPRRCPTIRCCGERMPRHSHQMGHNQQGVR